MGTGSLMLAGLAAWMLVSTARSDDQPRDEKPSDAKIDVDVPGARVRIGSDDPAGGTVDVEAPGVRVLVGKKAGEQGQATRQEAYLGLFADQLPQALAAQLGDQLPRGRGLLVTQVVAGSPAEKAGIQPHDVLVTYDGKPVVKTDELRRLIRADQPGRQVRIELLRAGRKQTIEAAVGERTVDDPADDADGVIPVTVRLFGRNAVIIGRDGIDVPGAVIRWGTPAETESTEDRPRTCSVTVDRGETSQWRLRITYSGPDGKTHERALEGSSEEVRARLDEFPPTVREHVRRALERAEREPDPGNRVRVSVVPRVQGAERGLHVSVLRPGAQGSVRLFELDHVFGGEKTIKVDELLEIKVLAGELQELSPAVREQVQDTLRHVEIPEVRVEVRDSL